MTQIATLDDLPISPYIEHSLTADLTKGLQFFPRLQLCGGATELGKTGKVPINHYALVRSKDQVDDLGLSVVCVPYSMRMKALDTSGDTPISFFNPEGAGFKDVYARSAIKDSGCMAGLEFLVWVPVSKLWATFYISAPTARPEAAVIKSRLQLGCELEHRMMKNRKGQVWPVPVCKPYSSPIDVPAEQEIRAKVLQFINEPESELSINTDTRER